MSKRIMLIQEVGTDGTKRTVTIREANGAKTLTTVDVTSSGKKVATKAVRGDKMTLTVVRMEKGQPKKIDFAAFKPLPDGNIAKISQSRVANKLLGRKREVLSSSRKVISKTIL